MKKIAIILILIQILFANSFKDKCDNGDMKSCAVLGVEHFENGKYSKAIELFKKSCDSKINAPTCGLLGVIYEEGRGVDVDLKKATHYYSKGCDLNYTKSCINLANLYRKRDMYKKAFEIDKQSCDGRKSKGNCYNVGRYYLSGKYVEGNITLAEKYFKLSCKYGADTGCKSYDILHIEKYIDAKLMPNNIVELPFEKCEKKGAKMPLYDATMNYRYKSDNNKTTHIIEYEFHNNIPNEIKVAIGDDKNCTIKSLETKKYLKQIGYKTVVDFGYKLDDIKEVLAMAAKEKKEKQIFSFFSLSKNQEIKKFGTKSVEMYYDKKIDKDRVTISTKDGKIHNFVLKF